MQNFPIVPLLSDAALAKIREDNEALKDSTMRACRVFMQAWSNMGKVACEFGRAFHQSAWDAYRSAGMPYGENEDGFQQWFKEQCAVHTAHHRVEQENQRAQDLADMRELGARLKMMRS